MENESAVAARLPDRLPVSRDRSWRSIATGLFQSLRPQQWTKNGFIFLAPLFAHQLHHPEVLAKTLLAFGLFCLLSGSVYLFNDIQDLPRDAAHPVKRNRPIASGRVPVPLALG